MSRSNPTLINPAEHFFRWAGSKGQLQWYNKEQEKNVQVKLPFEFLVLDELSTITGYHKQSESGFWSNEVRNVMNDQMYVKTKNGPFEAGTYATLAQTRAKGGKYAKSIYIAHKIQDKWVIGNIQASGSALSAWIEFTKTLNRGDLEKGKVTMIKGEKQDAPTGPFYAPEFKYEKASSEENEEAIKLDRELQIYLSHYLSTPKVDENGEVIHDDEIEISGIKTDGRVEGTSDDAADIQIEDINEEEPIDLDDIPF